MVMRLLGLFVSCVLVSVAGANDTIEFGAFSVPAGSRVSGLLDVPDTGDGVATSIPVTVFNGVKTGPVLALIAGVHGSEYSPILAMQRVVKRLDPADMSGAVIVVHNANLPAFRARTVYIAPDDQKNLNRSFPGRADGTITERIAYTLTEEVIKQSDYLIDMHAGDANEGLNPSYAAYYAEAGSEALIAESKRIAVAFGLETVVQFGGDVSTPEARIYTSATAVALGIPAMDVESGQLGYTEDRYVAPIETGVVNVMQELGILPGDPPTAEAPLFIAERARVYSEHDGVWHLSPRIDSGQYVYEGTRLGTITDYHGNDIAEVTANASGILLIVIATPPINVGDNLAVIGIVGE